MQIGTCVLPISDLCAGRGAFGDRVVPGHEQDTPRACQRYLRPKNLVPGETRREIFFLIK